jgi:hypothetical protein
MTARVRFAPDSRRTVAWQRNDAMCQKPTLQMETAQFGAAICPAVTSAQIVELKGEHCLEKAALSITCFPAWNAAV